MRTRLTLFSCLICLIILSVLAYNSAKPADARIYLDDAFYWAIGNIDDEVEDAQNLDYKKLEKLEYKNLRNIPEIGNDGKYVWLKAEFELPDELKGDDLSMLIPYLHFAEELYLNGEYIDDYGVMGAPEDKDIQEAGLMAHLFDFPEKFINQEGKNTVLIKVFALGNGSITKGVFVGFRQDAWRTSDIVTFWRTRVYIFLEGCMLCVCIFFLMIFIAYKKDRIYFYISLLNFFSMLFFSGFFGGDLPWVGFHGGISYFWFFKITKCASFFALEYLYSLLIFDFLKMKHTTAERIIRATYVIGSIGICLLAPNYYSLIKISHIIIWFSLIDVVISISIMVSSLKHPKRHESAKMLLISLSPFLASVFADFVIKTFFNNITLPYFSMFGWQLSIIIFFLYFSLSYSSIAQRLEYLNKELKNEVDVQTQKLQEAKVNLEHEMEVASTDMKMAAIVQQKFFHAPETKFKEWDLAVCYEPLSVVSGDLFNFYYDKDNLYGVSLFDASGHGVAASLVTMLSENIIRQVYEDSYKNHESLGSTLTKINTNIIQAKGDIDNFLTGILLGFKDIDKDTSEISIANAGHPRPFLYRYNDDTVNEVELPSDDYVFGPVGISGLEYDYKDYTIKMKKDDILILYTDGLTETMNTEREEFGKSHIQALLHKNSRKSSQEILNIFLTEINEFSSGAGRSDDITAIVLKRK